MGYTHYWTQSRDFKPEEWTQIRDDLGALLQDVQHVQGVALANAMGEPGSSPEFASKFIAFNGVGDDHHETFIVHRIRPRKSSWQNVRGQDFCKTARKPYDLAVTAALCYLSTVPTELGPSAFSVSSDGHGKDFLDGLAEARRALPRYANILDIPMDILRSDRWCMPWVSTYESSGFSVHFCVDGKGYVERIKSGDWYCFETHLALAQFLDKTKEAKFPRRLKVRFGHHVDDVGNVEPNIWNSYGSFDAARHKRLATAQTFALASLFDNPGDRLQKPPAYVRPGEMPEPATRSYSFSELLKELA
jgi:hypothetical protein